MRKSLFTFFVLLILVMTGCSDEETGTNHRGSDNGFNLSYTVTAPVSVLTRSAIDLENGEDRITSFYVLFFENTSGRTGRFLEAIDVMESHSGPVASSGNVAVTFPEGSSLNNASEYKMLVCANIEEYTDIDDLQDLITFCDGKTEREVTYLLHTITGVTPGEGEEDDDTNLMPSDNLPMSTSLVKPADATLLTVELDRTVARFDVFCEADGYELVSASIWNAYTESDVWEGNFSDFSAPRTERYYGVKANSKTKEIVGKLYAFQNYVPEPIQNDKVTTCLIIGLKNSEGGIEYFRTNVNVSNNYGQQLKRNTAYRTIVKNVLNKGDENERGAYENHKFSLDIDVNEWVVDENGTIQTDGDNVLAIPTSFAKLFTQGEIREYNVYTIGEGMPELTGVHLPKHIKATLTLAPGYSEQSNFKKSILTFKAGAGTTKDSNETYKVEIAFSTLSKTIYVEQTEGNPDFILLNPSEIIEVDAEAGIASGNVTVTSSGEWVAEILRDNFFSFEGGVFTTDGNSGDSFNVYALEHNAADDPRYWFVRIYLKEKPEVSQNLVIIQNGGYKYIRFNVDEISLAYNAAGTALGQIVISSNSPWTAELIIEEALSTATVGFNSARTQTTTTGNNDNSTTRVYLSSHYGNRPSRIIMRATVDNSDISADLVISQKASYTGELFISTAATGNGSLYSATNYNYSNYNLAMNMRKTALFGPGGSLVDMPYGGFTFKASTTANDMEAARIIQLISSPTDDVFNRAYTQYQANSSKLLLLGGISYAEPNSQMQKLQAKGNLGYGQFTTVKNDTKNYRELYQDGNNMEHPLIQYLLNGPAGPAIPDEILLQSGHSSDSGGLKDGDWPSTFVPIIKSTNSLNDKEFCVFGIDPVNRLILITDPRIFGALSSLSESTYPCKNNYVEANVSNNNFLNNFIAWMARVAVEGESFLQQFQ